MAGLEVIAVKGHVAAQQPAAHAHGDLAGAAGLRAVADAAGDHGHRVFQRVADGLVVRARSHATPQPAPTPADTAPQ